MRSRFSRGEVARIYLDVIVAGVGSINALPTIAIQRTTDGKWFQASDKTWQVNIVDNAMTATDTVFLPGRYHFDFDQTADDSDGGAYIAKKTCAAPAALEYEDLQFGAQPAAAQPGTCSVTGTIFRADGRPAPGELVRATLQPVFKDRLARGIQSDRVVFAYTDANGDFQISLVRTGIFRLEIGAIGYDRKVTIPDASTALFTDL